ncbi:MAG: hypothetical protein LBQ63_05550 [Deltaproteobacteria bacterium]|nr:hypothetical protein [Deltaproteobacteria bacterium]
MTGYWFPCFYIATLVIALYMLLGSLRRGKVDLVFFIFPICTFFVCWVLGFYLAQREALLFFDRMPDYTILGFHPSFFWIVLLYWIGGIFILGFGIFKLRDRWLAPDEWEAFRKKMAELNGGAVEHKEEAL